MSRRFRLAVAMIVWCGAVFWYWRTFVPFVPTDEFTPADGFRFRGISRNGQLVLATHPPEGDTGPIVFRDPLARRSVRQVLTASDKILDIVLGNREVAVIRRNGHAVLVDLADGKTLLSLPIDDAAMQLTLSPDGRQVASKQRNRITVHDVDRRSVVFESAELIDIEGFGFQGPGRFYCSHRVGHKPKTDCWSTETWSMDNRLKVDEIEQLSEDGRRAIVRIDYEERWVCDGRSGQRLWKFPSAEPDCRLFLTLDGSEVFRVTHGHGRDVVIARWNTDTGQLIATSFGGDEGIRNPRLSRNGRYVIFNDDRPPLQSPQLLVSAVNALGFSWSGFLGRPRPRITFADAHTGKPLGFIESQEQSSPHSALFGEDPSMQIVDVSDRGVVVWSPNGSARFFTLPPQRDWAFLVSWCLVPPILVHLQRWFAV